MKHRSTSLVAACSLVAGLMVACGAGTIGDGGSPPGTGGDTSKEGGSAAGAPGGGGAGAGATGDGGNAGVSAGSGGAAAGEAGTSADEPVPFGPFGCQVFPSDNPWNTPIDDVSSFPTDADSDLYIANIQHNGGAQFVHPDFGSNPLYGIPYDVVSGTQPLVPMTFKYESDPGPYPFPSDAPIEGGASAGGDRHVLVIDKDHCVLFETWSSQYASPGWSCGSGAKFDLTSNALRPDGWTSADAAGLPVFAGLVRYEEAVTKGAIAHALRFTIEVTRASYVHPATHFASDNVNSDVPPMGARLRMKASYDTSGFTGAAAVIAAALKKYGMFVADNGSNWYISGASDPRFNDDELDQLKAVPGTAFEVVKLGQLYP